MTFDILQHLDQLEWDGGTNNPRGDQSFKCPACGAPNFKVNVANGKWGPTGASAPAPRRARMAVKSEIPTLNILDLNLHLLVFTFTS